MVIKPPRRIAAQTWIWMELDVPIHVLGERMAAVTMAPIHCNGIKTTKTRLVFRATRSLYCWTSSPVLAKFTSLRLAGCSCIDQKVHTQKTGTFVAVRRQTHF